MGIDQKKWSRVYKDNIVVDGLLVGPPSGRHVQELLDCGITSTNWTVSSHRDDTVQAINKIIQFYWLLEQFPQSTLLVEKSSDIHRAKKEGKLGIILMFQTASPLGANVHLLRIFRRLGVRVIELAYNESSPLAAGCLEPSNGGLTSLGIQVIGEMNRIGILIDLSHVGERSSLEAIEVSKDPVIFSHSNARKLQENPRNVTDEQIKACAAKGGVIGLSSFSAFVGSTQGGRHPTLQEYLRHMDYLIDLVGPDHVGIGTDIMVSEPTDGVWWRATTGRLYSAVSQEMTYETHNIKGFMHHSDLPGVANAMVDHGYEASVIRKIIGGNWQRVYRQVWDKGFRP